MLAILIVLACLMLVIASAVYVFAAINNDFMKRVVEYASNMQRKSVELVHKLIVLPIEVHVVGLIALCVLHKLIILNIPATWIHLLTSATGYAVLGHHDIAPRIDQVTDYIRKRPFVKVLLAPLAIVVVVTLAVLSIVLKIMLDPEVTTLVAWIVCVPLGWTLLLWNTVPLVLPDLNLRTMLLGVSSFAAVAVVACVAALDFAPRELRALLLGTKLTPRSAAMYSILALAMTTALLLIQVDGTRGNMPPPIRNDQIAKNLDSIRDVKELYQLVLAVSCIVMLSAIVTLPHCNRAYFAYIRLSGAA